MRPRRPRAVLPLLALVLALNGCGKSSPTQPVFSISQADADDIVQQIAVTSVATDWGSYLLAGNTPQGAPGAGAARLRPARLGRVAEWDTTFTQGGLTFQFWFSFFDAALGAQPDYDPLTTYVVEEDSEITGSLTGTNFDAAFFHTGNLAFTGTRVADDTLRFSGVAQDTAFTHFTSAIRNVERWFHVELVRTVDGVRTLKTAGSYPHAGSVRWIVTATRLRSGSRADVEATLDAEATLTFNGTRFPVLTITGGWRYALDLETGAIARI